MNLTNFTLPSSIRCLSEISQQTFSAFEYISNLDLYLDAISTDHCITLTWTTKNDKPISQDAIFSYCYTDGDLSYYTLDFTHCSEIIFNRIMLTSDILTIVTTCELQGQTYVTERFVDLPRYHFLSFLAQNAASVKYECQRLADANSKKLQEYTTALLSSHH